MTPVLQIDSELLKLAQGRSMTRYEAQQAMDALVDAETPAECVALFLTNLRERGESVDEIAGFLDSLSGKALRVESGLTDLIDVCGTGGDGSGSFNVSTTVAFVLAASGQRVAKHGNRSVSSRSGSFDLLEALGVPFHSHSSAVLDALREFGIAFLFGPSFHPALKRVAAIRKSLGVPTVFNLLGPLLNPVVELRRQLLGVYAPSLVRKMAEVLKARGASDAMIVHGSGGLDELSLSGPTRVAYLKDGQIRELEFSPADFGLLEAPLAALQGGDPHLNAEFFLELLQGERGPRRDVVVMNAAAALLVGGRCRDLKEGVERARDALDSGATFALLKRLQASQVTT